MIYGVRRPQYFISLIQSLNRLLVTRHRLSENGVYEHGFITFLVVSSPYYDLDRT